MAQIKDGNSYIPDVFLQKIVQRTDGIARVLRQINSDISAGPYGSATSNVGGQTIRFTLEREHFVALDNLRFSFTAKTSGGSACFSNGVENLIKKVSLIVNENLATSQDYSGHFAHIYNCMTKSSKFKDTVGTLMMGYRQEGNYPGSLAFAGQNFSLPLGFDGSALCQDSLLPTFLLGKCQIEIILESDAGKILETAGAPYANEYYTILNPRLEFDMYQSQALQAKYDIDRYCLKSVGYVYQDWTVVSQNTQIQIPAPYKSIRGIMFAMRDSATGVNTTATSAKTHSFVSTNLTSWNFTLAGQSFPPNPIIKDGIHDVVEMMRLFGDNYDSPLINSWWATPATMQTLNAFSFQTHAGSISGIQSESRSILPLLFSSKKPTPSKQVICPSTQRVTIDFDKKALTYKGV